MEKLSQSITQLVKEACRYPPGSKERQKNLTQIIRLVNSRLWQENTPYYEDALQETWIYFCRNICKAYDPDKANVVTWLNNYLKWRLKDGYITLQQQQHQTVSKQVERAVDPVDRLPARAEIPPLLEEIEQWAREDVQYKLRQTHLKNRPQITARDLILSRLPPETPWKELAARYDVAVGTLSSFYQRKCQPLLREFSKSQGYI